MRNISHLFCMASEILESNDLHLHLLSGSTKFDDNEYLESLENAAELIVCRGERMLKLPICFDIKTYLPFKNISYPLDII